MGEHGGLSPYDGFQLSLACQPIRQAFPDYGPYLVGSTLTRRDPRDVDVRLILTDETYDRLVPDAGVLAMLNMAFAGYLRHTTGLPIDFGIQRQTEANEQHDGMRSALGIGSIDMWPGDCDVLAATPPTTVPASGAGAEREVG